VKKIETQNGQRKLTSLPSGTDTHSGLWVEDKSPNSDNKFEMRNRILESLWSEYRFLRSLIKHEDKKET
jgi:hypothetical protein